MIKPVLRSCLKSAVGFRIVTSTSRGLRTKAPTHKFKPPSSSKPASSSNPINTDDNMELAAKTMMEDVNKLKALKIAQLSETQPNTHTTRQVESTSEDQAMSTASCSASDTIKIESTTSVSTEWNWVRPTKLQVTATLEEQFRTDDDVIPVNNGVWLTNHEVIEGLTRLGGLNIKVVNLQGKLDTLEDFIICTGTSTRHLRKMSDVIVKALVSRGLNQAPGFTGAEGGTDDDWIVVDCYNLAVHLMLFDTRRALDLETHWANIGRDEIQYNVKTETPDEEQMTAFIERNPVPSYYNNTDYDHSINIDDSRLIQKDINYDKDQAYTKPKQQRSSGSSSQSSVRTKRINPSSSSSFSDSDNSNHRNRDRKK